MRGVGIYYPEFQPPILIIEAAFAPEEIIAIFLLDSVVKAEQLVHESLVGPADSMFLPE